MHRVMSKKFHVEPGLEALVSGFWYKPGVMLFVEEDEHVEIYMPGKRNRRGACVASYSYSALNPQHPPFGLRTAA
jgi:hypothetical protein